MTVFKIRHTKKGVHIVATVFAGPDFDHLAKCGDLVFREEEFISFGAQLFASDKLRWEEWEEKNV